jgi:hypothetical protein
MKSGQCDICNAEVKPDALNTLSGLCSTDEVKEVCGKCLKKLEDRNHRVEKACHAARKRIMRRYVERLREERYRTGSVLVTFTGRL